jgi:hypothetical protein
MSSLGGGAMKMTSRRHSTEATSGTPMERWFWARKGEIEAGGWMRWIMGVLSLRLL